MGRNAPRRAGAEVRVVRNRKTSEHTALTRTSKRTTPVARESIVQEHEARLATARLLAASSARLDGMLLLWDLTNLRIHEATARLLRVSGSAPGPAPVPVSRFMTNFGQQLLDKTKAVGLLLDVTEIEKLSRIAPGFLAALKAHELDVVRVICELMPYSPEVIVGWLRVNVDWIEQRFAS